MYDIKKLNLKLKTNWKISRNSSLEKENYILKFKDYESEIAPNVRYYEDSKLIESHFKELKKTTKMNLTWCNSFQSAINNVLMKNEFQGDLHKALEIPRVEAVKTSFSIPIMEESEVEEYLKKNSSFHFYKLKVQDESSLGLLKKVSQLTNKPLRVDANEGFKSLQAFLEFQDQIKDLNIEFIEQPFSVGMVNEYLNLKPKALFPIFADESVLLDFKGEKFQAMFDGINVKIMKSRGLENAKRLLLKGKQFGLKTMIGCMIETSLGISEAMTLAALADYIDLDGSLLIENDPYAHLIKLEDGHLVLNS